jgi:anti-anti-sigma regulatory factor
MLRITKAEQGNSTLFKLEGKLAGSWVEVMEQSWRQAVADSPGRPFVVDLTAITYIDTRGTQLLTEIHRNGAELRASSCLTKCIVEEIESRSGDPAKAGH